MLPIPYNTDAPIYFFPITTIVLIVVNALAFAVSSQASIEEVLPWTLQFGEGLHPVQWVTNNFLHADIIHIAGNMFFLWGFGLVVEGKIGWWKFLLLYLAIATIYGFIVQAIMLGSVGVALGASGAIFGLMMISVIWAPANEMNCFLWLFRPQLIEIRMTIFAGIYLIWQIVAASLTHFSMSSAMLHLTGAGVGAVFGVALLKLDLVDCEGWDLFAVWAGKEGKRAETKIRNNKIAAEPPPQFLSVEQAEALTANVKKCLVCGNSSGAAQLYQQQRRSHPEWKLSESELMGLIKSLHAQQLWSVSVPVMVAYLQQFPEKSNRVRLKLAQILIESERRPAKALKTLSKIDLASLTPELQTIHRKLSNRAKTLESQCDLEVTDEEE